MNATATKETNELGYLEINADQFRPLGNRILLKWEEHQSEFRVGKLSLVKHEKFKKLHYTGSVLALGPDVNEEIKLGDRLLFDQFSQFEKLFDPKYGRLALIDPDKQSSAFAIIPPRVLIDSEQGDYNYNA